MTHIDVTPLQDALRQLRTSLRYLNSPESRQDEELRKQFRAATIQAFEFTYELTTRLIRRQLENIVANPADLRGMEYKELLREAAGSGLVLDVERFLVYRHKRNITSHTYDEERAEEFIEDIDGFVRDVEHVLDQARRRQSATD